MAVIRANRLQAGSPSWISEERSSALHIVQSETEEFTYSVRNEIDWLNEHMAEIFSADRVSVADIFKTPAKLRGKTPRTVRKNPLLLERPPLSNIFSTASAVCSSPKHLCFADLPPNFKVAEDKTRPGENQSPGNSNSVSVSLLKEDHRSTELNLIGYSQKENFDPSTFEHVSRRSLTLQNIEPEQSLHVSDADSEDRVRNRCLSDPSLIINKLNGSPDCQSRQASIVTETQTTDKTQQNNSGAVQNSLISDKRSSNSMGTSPISPPEKQPSTRSAESPAQDLGLSLATEPIENQLDRSNSPSDGSSPILPIVRKSSLNFASLPAREPLTKKSLGNRLSRPSQLEQSRVSYFGLQTVGKNFENITNKDEREVEDFNCNEAGYSDTDTQIIRLHSKTSTQRLQDQISKLGQSHKSTRPWNPNNGGITHTNLIRSNQKVNINLGNDTVKFPQREPEIVPEIFSNARKTRSTSSSEENESLRSQSDRVILKTNSSENMNCLEKDDGLQNSNSVISTRKSIDSKRPVTNLSNHEFVSLSPNKSTYTLEERQFQLQNNSTSNPISQLTSNNTDISPKSPTKTSRNSPLKVAKDKFSSMIKNSKVLFANTIVSNAEDKFATNLLSVTQDESGDNETVEDFPCDSHEVEAFPTVEPIPCKVSSDTSQSIELSPKLIDSQSHILPLETEVKKDLQKKKSFKEAKNLNKMDFQLENARNKVREEAHLYHIEKERLIAMKNEEITNKACEKRVKENTNDLPRVTRNSPRKMNSQTENEKVNAVTSAIEFSKKDIEKSGPLTRMPAPTPSSKSQIGRPDNVRPLKPSRETSKTKAPTVIKVDIGSQRSQQYHPSNTTLSATLQESLSSQSNPPPYSLRHKASTSSVQSKSSSSSFKSVATKTLEAATRKKERDEPTIARKRDVKIEIERQRVATKQEERRKEILKKRKEAENQAYIQREREKAAKISEMKKATSRQAIEKRRLEIEKTKETRMAPQSVRNEISSESEKARSTISKPSKTQQEPTRTAAGNINVSTLLPPKRLFQHDIDDQYVRPNLQRNGNSHLHIEQQSKRRKTNESDKDFGTDNDRPKMTAPPIRQSGIRHKEISTKSIFSNNYANSISSSNLQRSTLISQHNLNQSKLTHPMDMVQLSKGPIPFAPISSQESSQVQNISAHKVASNLAIKSNAKSSAKNVPRSSPRYQNGENIDLPEINTDSDNEDSEEDVGVRPGWTDTPEIQRQLAYQESLDPAEVFGQPGPLNMEEVFSKCKDRFPKFRARTSSANWSGTDKLTEDEIQRDLEGRDRVRRQGGWTYDAMV